MTLKYTSVLIKSQLVGYHEYDAKKIYLKGLRETIGEENFARLMVTGKVTFERKTGDPESDAIITYEIIKGEAK